MEVLELEHERHDRGGAVEDVDHALEENGLGDRKGEFAGGHRLTKRGQIRQEPGQGRPILPKDGLHPVRIKRSEEPPQGLDDRREGGTGVSDIHTRPNDDSRAARLGSLVPPREEPRLADAGVGADQDRRRPSRSRSLERTIEGGQLRGPTDKGRALDSTHSRSVAGVGNRPAATDVR